MSEDAPARAADELERLRRENTRLRRREHELSALFASARELAELRDSDAVLARLVQRAHEMMGADVTYLSEFDPASRELRVRETSGSVSAAFQQLRVPAGAGLASAIVETRAAQWVSRYADYASDRHERGIDDAVSAEGLVSILGVPMLTDDEVLGVLFVADRDEHVFTPEEIALLSALADHASIVLQTARTLRELRSSEDETRHALESLTEHLTERDRANTVHQELVHAVLAGGGFSPVAETLSSALDRTVAIVDAGGRLIAAAGLPLPEGMVELADATRAAIEESRASGHCVLVEGVPGVHAVAALTAGPQFFGTVLLGDGDFALGAVDRRTVERAAQVGALLALQQEAVAGAEHRTQSELVAELLDAVPERRGDVERRVRRLGIDPERLDALALFVVPGEHRAGAARTLAPSFDQRALVGEYRGFVVVCYDGDTVSPDLEQLRARVARAVQRPVLAVVPPRAAGALPAAAGQALRTARLLAALGADDLTARTEDYLPYSAILDADERALAAFLDGTIGAVRRYDESRGTDLLGTLRAFVRHNASPTRTARALNFHTNTILQRLERLDAVLGEGWRDDERLFRIGLATRLDELSEQLGGG
ncbi:helix-turn-helix domain-containing protein [Protaetiibacter intestinalis]|uniref:GAF domain-containing protein n=1 Tax=Protaetiibacter intestinalis TaxID=2419774 RepID=A0A387BH80_9MICO|nr:GAF domain-containing protein [Protaetiibacter intestinalis]AYF97880.1 GAF domain-containing protein [Protaetiibacter intestinalis]